MTRRFDRTRRASPCECTGNSPSELVCVYPRIGYTCIRIRPKLGLIRDYWSSVRLPPPAAQIRNPTHTTRLIPTPSHPSPHLPLSCPLSLSLSSLPPAPFFSYSSYSYRQSRDSHHRWNALGVSCVFHDSPAIIHYTGVLYRRFKSLTIRPFFFLSFLFARFFFSI